jgi:hypothetical protein
MQASDTAASFIGPQAVPHKTVLSAGADNLVPLGIGSRLLVPNRTLSGHAGVALRGERLGKRMTVVNIPASV